jgi:hypothetical protein
MYTPGHWVPFSLPTTMQRAIVQVFIFWTSALVGVERSALLSGRFTPGKEALCPFDRRLGGLQSRSLRRGEEKLLDLTGTRNSNLRPSSL